MSKKIYDPTFDPYFQNPYIDVDEWRERPMPDGSRIPFRYIHGGFEETNVKFLFCFPEKNKYDGRFFQYLSPFPGPDEEVASYVRLGDEDRIGFALACGAYIVESNMGSTSNFGAKKDDTLVWKSSAAVAEYSRVKAKEIYGCDRPYGYVYGGSGGGYKTMACVENTKAWDGGLPYVIGTPYSLPNTITMHVKGQRVLRNCFDKIYDAFDVGGDQEAVQKLKREEREMLQELTLMGFPPNAWYLEAKGEIDSGALPVILPGIKAKDPDYFVDFWNIQGYEGADASSTAVRDRIQFNGVVKSVQLPAQSDEFKNKQGQNGVDDAWKKMLAGGNGAWIELEEVPIGKNLYLEGVNIVFLTGESTGKILALKDIIHKKEGKGGYLTIGFGFGMEDMEEILKGIHSGDTILLDNSDYIAVQSYYRHQCPKDPDLYAWKQFCKEDGTPMIPQRDEIMGMNFSGTGTIQDGNIQCKIINIQALMDEATCPWCADWYKKQVEKSKGSLQDHRVYYMQRCMHGDTDARKNYMVVDYMGALRQSLIDLSKWVEKGIEPSPSTDYVLGKDNQIHVNPDIVKRHGIQPTISVMANQKKCAHVKVGEEVRFEIDVRLPQGIGEVTELVMSYEELESIAPEQLFPIKLSFERNSKDGVLGANAYAMTCYKKPGIYFATVRVMANRQGDISERFFQIKNLDRVRIVVE